MKDIRILIFAKYGTLQACAEACRAAGYDISTATLSRQLANKTKLTARTIRALVEVLEIEPEEIGILFELYGEAKA